MRVKGMVERGHNKGKKKKKIYHDKRGFLGVEGGHMPTLDPPQICP
jgi:hypothetical protein